MNWLCLVIYVYIIAYPLLRKNRDFFSPVGLWAILTLFNSAPFLAIIFSDISLANPIAYDFLGKSYYSEIRYFMLIQCLFAIIYYISYSRISIHTNNKKTIFSIPVTKRICRNLYIFFYFSSVLLSVIFIISFGGFMELIASFTNRNEIVGERQVFFSLTNTLVSFGAIFHIRYLSYCSKRGLGIAICLLIGLFITSLYGGRSPFLAYMLMVGLCYNYFINRVNLFSIKLLPIYLCGAFFFVLILGLRISSESSIDQMIADNASSVFGGNMYVEIQACIHHYFESHEFWLGKTFANLYDVFLPHQFYANKLPTDDGCYYFTIVYEGGDVFNQNEFLNSWPPSTLGSMYANFGLFGVAIGAVILAYVQKYTFALFIKEANNVLLAFLFSFLVTKFQLTRFYIANLLFNLVYVFAFSFIIRLLFSKVKIHNKF